MEARILLRLSLCHLSLGLVDSGAVEDNGYQLGLRSILVDFQATSVAVSTDEDVVRSSSGLLVTV